MRCIIAPAKKMREDTDSFAVQGTPVFLEQTRYLMEVLQGMTHAERKALWKCNESIAALNSERLSRMDLSRNLTPAVIAYEGLQYQYMAPQVMDTASLDYIQEHLRIVSGFYGLLRPFDGVTPYRLEMQAKLKTEQAGDLYTFWGGRIADALSAGTDLIINLASKEYSRAVEPWLPTGVRFVTCVFGELNGNKVVEKGARCKMARGQMVRWMAEHLVETVEELPAFSDLGYRFDPQRSDDRTLTFLRNP